MPTVRLLAVLLLGFAAGTYAQTPEQSVGAPAGTATRAWTIVPVLTVQETVTDNVALSPAATRMSDEITDISPGVKIDANTARLKMHFDYQLHEQIYAQGSQGNQLLQSLNSFGTLEAIEKLFYVDMSGVIAQQNISAFGATSPGYYSINPNVTETSDFRVSPYLKGKLAGNASYEVRYSYSAMRAKAAEASDLDLQEWSGKVSGDTALAFLGWAADANRQTYDYRLGSKTESDRLRGFVKLRLDPQFKLSASLGREANDFLTASKTSWNTYGYGADWDPTDRTQVSAFREKRFFGFGHNLTIAHRLPLSAVRYSDIRDIAALPNQFGAVGMGNMYDLLFAQMASSIPDETARAAYVNNLLSASGIAPNTPASLGFLSSQISVQRQQELSYVLRGARNVITVAAIRSQNDQLGTGLGTGDDFSLAASIKQQGWSAGWSNQLSGLSSLNVTGSHTHNVGATSALNPALSQNMLSASISTKLGAKTNGAVTVRRTVVDSATAPYTENAVVGSLFIQF